MHRLKLIGALKEMMGGLEGVKDISSFRTNPVSSADCEEIARVEMSYYDPKVTYDGKHRFQTQYPVLKAI